MTIKPTSLFKLSILLFAGSTVIGACSDASVSTHEQETPNNDDSEHEPSQPAPPAFAKELDRFVDAALDRYRVPGAAIAIVRDGGVAYQRGYGVRSTEDTAKVTTDTAFLVGSLNKSMTTLMMATLVDDGLLDWNQPVTDLIPTFSLSEPNYTAQIRVRDLVNHSNGVPAYDTPYALEYLPPTRMIESIRDIPVVGAPGTVYNYCNQTFATGGFAAAIAAGAQYTDESLYSTYVSLMQERVFNPIGMSQTTFDYDAVEERNHALPHGYDALLEAVLPLDVDNERFLTSVAPAGAVWSTIDDMGRYAMAQLYGRGKNGKRIASQENMAETRKPQIAMSELEDYALGWVVIPDFPEPGSKAFVHQGETSGFTAAIIVAPEEDLAVVILTNRGSTDPFWQTVLTHTVEMLRGSPYSSDEDNFQTERAQWQTVRDVMTQTVALDGEMLATVGGEYDHQVVITNTDLGAVMATQFGDYPLVLWPEQGIVLSSGRFNGFVAGVPGADDQGAPTLTLGQIGEQGLEWPLQIHKLQH